MAAEFNFIIVGAGSSGCVLIRDLPGVRRNLQEHASLAMIFKASGPCTLDPKRDIRGVAVQTDDEIDAYVRRSIGTAMHCTSTCSMGSGPLAVVDEALRVRGADGLRVANCSIMPTLPGGNTHARRSWWRKKRPT